MTLHIKEKNNSYIRIRVTEKEKEELKEIANEKGLTLTDLVKTAINEYLKR